MPRPLTTFFMLPVLIAQAIWVVWRAQRLPEAAGDRVGTLGEGPPLRLLIVGDSSAAGVGVDHQRDALAGRLAAHLSAHRAVSWTVIAKSGATTASTLRLLSERPDQAFDVAVVALGVNDTKNGVSEAVWRRNYADILTQLETRFSITQICVSGVPPIGEFPLLPKPLRTVLGQRAARLDNGLRDLANTTDGVTHVPLDFQMDAAFMAADGFHPGPKVYDAWAARVVELLMDMVGQLDRDQ